MDESTTNEQAPTANHSATTEMAMTEIAMTEIATTDAGTANAVMASAGTGGWVIRPGEKRDVPRVETLLRKNAAHLRGRLEPLGRGVGDASFGGVAVAELDGVVGAAAWACNRFAAMDDRFVPMWVLEALEVRAGLDATANAVASDELAGRVHDELVRIAGDAGVAVIIGVGDAGESQEWDAYGYRRVPAGCSLLYTCDESGAVIPVSCDDDHVLYVLVPGRATPVLDAVAMVADGLDGQGRIEVIPGGAGVVRQLVEQAAAEAQ
jgi:hypothetical protein